MLLYDNWWPGARFQLLSHQTVANIQAMQATELPSRVSHLVSCLLASWSQCRLFYGYGICNVFVEEYGRKCWSTAVWQVVSLKTTNECLVSCYRWFTGKWQSCTVTCGGGVEQRAVYCVPEHDDSIFEAAVSDDFCSSTKPASLRLCNEQPCPRWFTGVWSPVRFCTHHTMETSGSVVWCGSVI